MPKPTVVIGLLGSNLDAGRKPNRWERWRPTVSLCQREELLVARLELLHEPKFAGLAQQVADDIRSVSPETETRLHEAAWADAWDFADVFARLFEFAKAYPFRPDDEEYLIHITTGSHVAQICLFLLTETRFLPGKLIQTSPGKGPADRQRGGCTIIDLDLSKYDSLASRFAQEHRDSVSFLKSGIDTRNERFNRLIDQIERVAINSKSPILLTGPTGAGKSRLARQVYELKRQRRQVSGRFVEVNCATLRGDNAMSAMFGHVKGAFTGAASDRPGLLRAADGGLLFLDEIGELGADEQAMLLRALEDKRFLPVGTEQEAHSDFQLIAGSNRDLALAAQQGRFRDDLLARINLWTFDLLPLRERPEDIEPNLRFELQQFARVHQVNVTFNKEAHAQFLKFAVSRDAVWSGNFRDLNAAVTRMATLAQGGRITIQVVSEEIDRLTRLWSAAAPATAMPSATEDDLLRETIPDDDLAKIDPFDQAQLAAVIRICRESRTLSDAGRRLFAASRAARTSTNDADRLRKYLARFGLDWRRISERQCR